MKKKIIISIVAVAVLAITVGGVIMALQKSKVLGTLGIIPGSGKDIWEYVAKNDTYDGGAVYEASAGGVKDVSTVISSSSVSSAGKYTSSSDSYLGYTVGGSQNAKNFRENIKNNYLPLSTDITYNGIYSEYYFDTGDVKRKSEEMFSPSYATAVSTNPITGEKEYYMSVGLNSNIKESDFNRKNINLVVVLDISGSMSSSFNKYYYDKKDLSVDDFDIRSKMKLAEECVNSLIDKLRPDDRIGIVLFESNAHCGCKITKKSEINIDSLKSHILEVEPRGGTNFSAGYDMASNLYNNEMLFDENYDNRIVVVTDAMPNMGQYGDSQMLSRIKSNADKKLYTSFVGVGVDFNTKFTENVSDVKGFNYYSVHSGKEFNKILAEDFDYMVTPLVFDLNLDFKSNNYEIAGVYGSDSVNKSSGTIMHINTLFPSSSNSDGDVKGGIVLLKLKKRNNSDNSNIELNVSYKDRADQKHNCNEKVVFNEGRNDFYDNTGIRKAILLARYVGTMKNWILYEQSKYDEFKAPIDVTCYDHEEEYAKVTLGINERKSIPLSVSSEYKDVFKKFLSYMESEKKELKDEDLINEIEVVNQLIK